MTSSHYTTSEPPHYLNLSCNLRLGTISLHKNMKFAGIKSVFENKILFLRGLERRKKKTEQTLLRYSPLEAFSVLGSEKLDL